jgi:hypothetical protein
MKHPAFFAATVTVLILFAIALPACRKEQDNPTTLPPSGNAGGDLMGNYPNPNVAKLQGNAVSITPPVNGQALLWNATTNQWEPGMIAGAGLWSITGNNITNSNSGNTGIGVAAPSAKLHVNGTMKIDAANTLEFGAGVAGKETNAGKIGYQTFTTNALDIVGAGTSSSARRIKFWSEGGATFTGGLTLGRPRLTATSTGEQNNLLPVAMARINADGTVVSDMTTPGVTCTWVTNHYELNVGVSGLALMPAISLKNGAARFVTWEGNITQTIRVYVWTFAGNLTQSEFTIVCYVL